MMMIIIKMKIMVKSVAPLSGEMPPLELILGMNELVMGQQSMTGFQEAEVFETGGNPK